MKATQTSFWEYVAKTTRPGRDGWFKQQEHTAQGTRCAFRFSAFFGSVDPWDDSRGP